MARAAAQKPPEAAAGEARALDLLAAFRGAVVEAAGWRRMAIAFAAGLVSVLAFAPFFLSPVLLVTLPVLVWLIDGTMRPDADRSAYLAATTAGWWFGFGFFLAGLFWVGEAFLVEKEVFGWALPFAVTLLPAGLALFWAAAAAAARSLWTPGLARVLVLAVALACAEWLRGHILTGFPWNVLGYALTFPLVLMQAAGVLGIYGLTLWAVVIFAAPLVSIADAAPAERRRAMLTALAVAVIPAALLAGYGAFRLSQPPSPAIDGVRVRIVQPSVPQREKWRPENQGAIFRDHLDLTRRNETGLVDDLAGITHVVWPEAAMPFLPLEHPEALDAIKELLADGTFLLSGALRRERAADGATLHAFNSLMVFDGEGALSAVYDKIHLVPFGEFLPFQPFLEAIGLEQLTRLRGGFTPGPTPRPLISAGALTGIGSLICYEAIFPGEVGGDGARPDVLVNVTNDGWFGDTTGPQQHFHQARVRAVEQGMALIRAANNGISAVVDPDGRVLKSLKLDQRGALDTEVPRARAPTVYARSGAWMFACNVLLFAAIVVVLRRRRRL